MSPGQIDGSMLKHVIHRHSTPSLRITSAFDLDAPSDRFAIGFTVSQPLRWQK